MSFCANQSGLFLQSVGHPNVTTPSVDCDNLPIGSKVNF